MRYDIFKATAPAMSNLGKGTECIKILLSQASKDMHETVSRCEPACSSPSNCLFLPFELPVSPPRSACSATQKTKKTHFCFVLCSLIRTFAR